MVKVLIKKINTVEDIVSGAFKILLLFQAHSLHCPCHFLEQPCKPSFPFCLDVLQSFKPSQVGLLEVAGCRVCAAETTHVMLGLIPGVGCWN